MLFHANYVLKKNHTKLIQRKRDFIIFMNVIVTTGGAGLLNNYDNHSKKKAMRFLPTSDNKKQ